MLNLKHFSLHFLALALAVGTFAFTGCADTANGPDSAAPPAEEAENHDHEHDHTDGDHDHAGGDDSAAAEISKLSPEDAAAAREQGVCVVSGEPLGTMGVPVKAEVKGQTVWLCCESCREALMKEPEKYLSKLEEE